MVSIGQGVPLIISFVRWMYASHSVTVSVVIKKVGLASQWACTVLIIEIIMMMALNHGGTWFLVQWPKYLWLSLSLICVISPWGIWACIFYKYTTSFNVSIKFYDVEFVVNHHSPSPLRILQGPLFTNIDELQPQHEWVIKSVMKCGR